MEFSSAARLRFVQIAIVFSTCLFLLLSFPQTASADEYSVSIDVYWLGSTLSGPFCNPTCNQAVFQFASTFDVYANGSLVPGSMIFSVSGIADGAAFVFDATPPSYTASETGNTSFTAGSPFNWSSRFYADVITFLPPGCSYIGPSTCVSASWPPTGNAVFSPSTVSINAFADVPSYPFLYSCWNQGCFMGPSGEDNLADGGSVTITHLPISTPEPGSLGMLLSGLLGLILLVTQKWCRGNPSA